MVISYSRYERLPRRQLLTPGAWVASIFDVATWGEFSKLRPDLAEAGAALLYQHGVGLGFMSTIREDMGPRVHPMCPLLTHDGVFAFIIPSPKQDDLSRDGRYAIHSFPCPENEDAFYFTGTAQRVEDQGTRQALGDQFVNERSQFGVAFPATEDVLFGFDIERCLLTKTTRHGDPNPQHTVWRADRQVTPNHRLGA